MGSPSKIFSITKMGLQIFSSSVSNQPAKSTLPLAGFGVHPRNPASAAGQYAPSSNSNLCCRRCRRARTHSRLCVAQAGACRNRTQPTTSPHFTCFGNTSGIQRGIQKVFFLWEQCVSEAETCINTQNPTGASPRPLR